MAGKACARAGACAEAANKRIMARKGKNNFMFKSLIHRLFSATPIVEAGKPKSRKNIQKIGLFHGNILEHTDCDALVSFITADLTLEGPLNIAYLKAAGEELGDYIAEHIIKPQAGEVFVVPAFGLPVRNIVLAVLPKWGGGIDDEDRAMIRCYRRALERAHEFHLQTLAFPALGFGRLNFPHIRFARHAVRGLLEGMHEDITEVRIVGKEQRMLDIYAKQIKKLGG